MTIPNALLTKLPCRSTAILIGCAALLAGCATSDSGDRAAVDRGAAPSTTTSGQTDRGAESTTEESDFGIGAMTAYELGYRVDWRSHTGADNVTVVNVQDDTAFVLDERNFLSRMRVDDGARIWRTPVADPIEGVFGVTDAPQHDRVYLMAGGALLELERSTGGLVGRQKLEKISNTPAARFGEFLVYGARNGQVVWHSFAVAFQWRATQVAHSIKVQPVSLDDFVAVVGNDGELMVLSARQARARWSTRLLDEVVCTPTLSSNALYVAGTDQHLRSYDIRSGRPLWKVLTRSPLTESPVLIGDQLYQQIPTEGLVCFDALPIDSPGGKKIWTADDVTGSVITKSGRDLIAWDAERRVLQVLDEEYGSLKNSVKLPNAERLFATGLDNGDLYVIDRQGVMTRVVPRN